MTEHILSTQNTALRYSLIAGCAALKILQNIFPGVRNIIFDCVRICVYCNYFGGFAARKVFRVRTAVTVLSFSMYVICTFDSEYIGMFVVRVAFTSRWFSRDCYSSAVVGRVRFSRWNISGMFLVTSENPTSSNGALVLSEGNLRRGIFNIKCFKKNFCLW